MKKILVTTDFSTASKAGLRFAIQLASKTEVELVFFHCFQALIPTTVFRDRIDRAIEDQSNALLKKLERFVNKVYESMKKEAGAHRFVVQENLDLEGAILEYAKKRDFDFICMCTRGAGGLLKIIGTHTGNILMRSSRPVMVVPHHYRVRPLQKILYASDLENFDWEMDKVADFGQTLQVKTDLAHFYRPGEVPLHRENLSRMARKKYPELDRIYLEPYHLGQDFALQLSQLTRKTHPGILVIFTHSKRSWFDRMFGVSAAETLSFVTKTPMLVFRKTAK